MSENRKFKNISVWDRIFKHLSAKLWETPPDSLKYLHPLRHIKKVKLWKSDTCPCKLCKTCPHKIFYI